MGPLFSHRATTFAVRVVGMSTVATAFRWSFMTTTQVSHRGLRDVATPLTQLTQQLTQPLTRRMSTAEPSDAVTGTKFGEDDETKNPQRRPGHQVKGMPTNVDPEVAARQAKIREHQEGCTRLSWAEEIRTMVAQENGFGVLSTVATKDGIQGFPVGAVVGFAVDAEGRPIFCFSTMSSHTKHLDADNRASLTITEPMFQGAADARCVLTGTVCRVGDETLKQELREAYHQSHKTAFWVNFGDFHMYRMDEILDVSFVGGFARAGGVTPDEYSAAEVDPVAGFLKPVADHMNADHEDALQAYVTALVGAAPVAEAKMKRLDRFGFDVRVVDEATKSTGVLRVPFAQPVTDRKGIKAAIVALSRDAAEIMQGDDPDKDDGTTTASSSSDKKELAAPPTAASG